MTNHTKRVLDGAIDELKRNGFNVIVILFDTKSDESRPLGSAMEVLCSMTNDPKQLAAIAKSALHELSVAGGQKASPVILDS